MKLLRENGKLMIAPRDEMFLLVREALIDSGVQYDVSVYPLEKELGVFVVNKGNRSEVRSELDRRFAGMFMSRSLEASA